MTGNSELVACLNGLKPRVLEGLTSSEVASIIKTATRRRFLAHSVMTHEGSSADCLFLMISGRARAFYMTPQGEKLSVQWFPPGEIFGLAAFLSRPVQYLSSTEAVMGSTVLRWDRATIRFLGTQYPELLQNALLIAYDYFVRYQALHIAAACQTARQRLAQVLKSLANGMGQRVTGGVELNIRNEELANEANITIFTASRLLNEWQRKGILTKSRGKIVLRSPETLGLSKD